MVLNGVAYTVRYKASHSRKQYIVRNVLSVLYYCCFAVMRNYITFSLSTSCTNERNYAKFRLREKFKQNSRNQ